MKIAYLRFRQPHSYKTLARITQCRFPILSPPHLPGPYCLITRLSYVANNVYKLYMYVQRGSVPMSCTVKTHLGSWATILGCEAELMLGFGAPHSQSRHLQGSPDNEGRRTELQGALRIPSKPEKNRGRTFCLVARRGVSGRARGTESPRCGCCGPRRCLGFPSMLDVGPAGRCPQDPARAKRRSRTPNTVKRFYCPKANSLASCLAGCNPKLNWRYSRQMKNKEQGQQRC